jgi:hypothetical protein
MFHPFIHPKSVVALNWYFLHILVEVAVVSSSLLVHCQAMASSSYSSLDEAPSADSSLIVSPGTLQRRRREKRQRSIQSLQQEIRQQLMFDRERGRDEDDDAIDVEGERMSSERIQVSVVNQEEEEARQGTLFRNLDKQEMEYITDGWSRWFEAG